jgi:ATP-dependent helicase IRC3
MLFLLLTFAFHRTITDQVFYKAHHSAAKSYRAILSHFDPRLDLPLPPVDLWLDSTPELSPIIPKSQSLSPSIIVSSKLSQEESPRLQKVDSRGRACVPILGFTATFSRTDGLALGTIFEKIVYHSDWLSMIKGGWFVMRSRLYVSAPDSSI